MTIRSYAAFFLCGLVALAASATPARAALNCYTLIPATMVTTVTSAGGYSGEVFRFKTTAAATTNGVSVPAGTPGYGIVLNAVPASNRARNGIIVLEARYLLLGGRHLQITGDPRDASILSHGPSVLGEGAGVIPVPGLGMALKEGIQGSNITIGPGYNFHVVPIGNLMQRGPCLQTATPTPAQH
jgi:hypothetical protein